MQVFTSWFPFFMCAKLFPAAHSAHGHLPGAPYVTYRIQSTLKPWGWHKPIQSQCIFLWLYVLFPVVLYEKYWREIKRKCVINVSFRMVSWLWRWKWHVRTEAWEPWVTEEHPWSLEKRPKRYENRKHFCHWRTQRGAERAAAPPEIFKVGRSGQAGINESNNSA